MKQLELDLEPVEAPFGKASSASPYGKMRSRYRDAVDDLYSLDPPTYEGDFIVAPDGSVIIGSSVPDKGGQPLRPYMTGGTLPRQSARPPPPEPDPNEKYREANAEAETRSNKKTQQGIINKKKRDKLLKRKGG